MKYIDWQTDPLLLDSEPTQMNGWLTANKILSMGRQSDSLFVDMNTLTLNIFPILVRKIDFVREKDSDRILSRFPFLVLTEEEKEIIKSKLLLIAEFARDYFYKSINGRVSYWTKRLNTYLTRGAMPYPLLRCACEITKLPLVRPNVDSLAFENARGKRYTIPITLTKQIAYLCGVFNGDGNLRKHFINIVDETKEHILFLSKLLLQMFATTSELFQSGNAWVVKVHSSAASRLINFLTDQTIDGAKYDSLQEPLLFKKLGEPFRKYYWGGAMDADGSFKNSICFISASDKYVKDLQEYLQSINITSKVTRVNDVATSLYIPAEYKVDFIQGIGVINPKKACDYQSLLQSNTTFYEYQSINMHTLIKEEYFNFELAQSLLVKGLGKFLSNFRGGRNYSTMREMFDLSAGSYASFERNE